LSNASHHGTVSPSSREQSYQLLRRLTWWVGGASALAMAVLAFLSAATIPGSSDAAAGSTASSVGDDSGGYRQDEPQPDQAGPLQPVQTAPRPSFGGTPHARSGGSR